ncbi:MAG: hypothetical protein DMF98_27520 [Acidobacteria bacterium]|nr:MAG: hypothetical protein DMF98_27520 [Acidobacteriota bacterium]
MRPFVTKPTSRLTANIIYDIPSPIGPVYARVALRTRTRRGDRMKAKQVFSAAALAAALAAAQPASAQFTSTIEGTVFDPSGLVTPGATVTLVNLDTGVSQNVVTNPAGYYRFPALPAGPYRLRVELQGFRSLTQENIRLAISEIKTINVRLEVGNTAESVTVTASVPLVETAEGRVSGLITGSEVKDLPLVGRNFFNLVVLTPGVSGRAAGGGQAYAQSNADIFINEYSVSMNANGARTESNNFMVDSSTISSSQRSGVVNVTPNPEVVEEVRVAVNNFSAEYGRNGSVAAAASSTRTTICRRATASRSSRASPFRTSAARKRRGDSADRSGGTTRSSSPRATCCDRTSPSRAPARS